jgi:hypothetical protein
MNGNKGISIKLNPSIIYIFGKKRLGTMERLFVLKIQSFIGAQWIFQNSKMIKHSGSL